MPTKKRAKGARAAGRKSGAAERRGKPAAGGSPAKKPTGKARRGRAAVARKATAPARVARRKSAAPAAEREIARLKARLQREKSTLEKRLTEAVREIGQLRYHEARTAQLERQLLERDQVIQQLRGEVGALRTRSHERAHEADEAQRSLSFGSSGTPGAEEVESDSGFYDGEDEPV